MDRRRIAVRLGVVNERVRRGTHYLHDGAEGLCICAADGTKVAAVGALLAKRLMQRAEDGALVVEWPQDP